MEIDKTIKNLNNQCTYLTLMNLTQFVKILVK